MGLEKHGNETVRIKITPEMLEAGKHSLYRFLDDAYDDDATLKAIFRRMLAKASVSTDASGVAIGPPPAATTPRRCRPPSVGSPPTRA